ncbi:hypothetical protein FRC15_008161, partial [Serendipita sp. 397]
QPIQTDVDANIYGCLFTRGDGTFHYALGVDNGTPKDTRLTLQKLHVTNPAGGWIFETKEMVLRKGDIYGTCCVVLKIGKLGRFQIGDLERFLLPKTPTPKDGEARSLSHVWFIRAIQTLKANKVVHCTNIDALTNELAELGNRQYKETEMGKGYILATSDNCW